MLVIIVLILVSAALFTSMSFVFPSYSLPVYVHENVVIKCDKALYYDMRLLDAALESRFARQEGRRRRNEFIAWIAEYRCDIESLELSHDGAHALVTYADGSRFVTMGDPSATLEFSQF